MTIIIYRLETIDNKPMFIEKGRWLDGVFSGELEKYPNASEEEVIDEFNRGYWRTSEPKGL